jgi:hypothetical protein
MEDRKDAKWTTVNEPGCALPVVPSPAAGDTADETRRIIAGPGDLIVVDRTKLKMLRHPSSDESREIILITDKEQKFP